MASYIKPIIYKDSTPRYTPNENSKIHLGYHSGYTEFEAFCVAEKTASEYNQAHKRAQSNPNGKKYKTIEFAIIPLQGENDSFYIEDRSTREC